MGHYSMLTAKHVSLYHCLRDSNFYDKYLDSLIFVLYIYFFLLRYTFNYRRLYKIFQIWELSLVS